MGRMAVLIPAIAASMLAPHGAAAQPSPKLSLTIPIGETPFDRPAAPFTRSDKEAPRRPGGIVLGIQVAPGAKVGIGMFGSKTPRGTPDPAEAWKPKSRKAGVGLSLKF
jgi:hypothetical protein